jgi:hypothetical protein
MRTHRFRAALVCRAIAELFHCAGCERSGASYLCIGPERHSAVSTFLLASAVCCLHAISSTITFAQYVMAVTGWP